MYSYKNMTILEEIEKNTREHIKKHPYVIDENGLHIPYRLVDSDGIESGIIFGEELFNQHADTPIDLIVGDDVSGRVPTLIAHRLFRLATLKDE